MPSSLQRLSLCLRSILAVLECPVCLDTIPPPAHQCGNGHLICLRCRVRSEKCPVCRVKFSRGRSLLADQIYNSIKETFSLHGEKEDEVKIKLRERIFGKKRPEDVTTSATKPKVTLDSQKSPKLPKNKLLSRLLHHKSSSVEHLPACKSLNAIPRHILNSDSIKSKDSFDDSNLIARSFSTGEICRPDSPLSRSPSSLASSSTGNFLEVPELSTPRLRCNSLDACKSRRIRHGSLGDELHTTGLSVSSKYHCPVSSECKNLYSENDVCEHIKYSHGGPLVEMFKPNVMIPLNTIMQSMATSVVFQRKTFFYMTHVRDSSYDCVSWLWLLGSKEEVSNYKAIVSFSNGEIKSSFQIPIHSLSQSWKDVTTSTQYLVLPREFQVTDNFEAKDTAMKVGIEISAA